MFCRNCGIKLDDDMTFCTSCGVEIKPVTDIPAPAEKPAQAAVFAEEVRAEIPAEDEMSEKEQPGGAGDDSGHVGKFMIKDTDNRTYFSSAAIIFCLVLIAVLSVTTGIFSGMYFSMLGK